jgi:uncharacterized Zn finger protein
MTHRVKDNRIAALVASHETRHTKAVRYLASGRIKVEHVIPNGLVIARVKGDSGPTYTVSWHDDEARWGCSCPSRVSRCSHVIAVNGVTPRDSAW